MDLQIIAFLAGAAMGLAGYAAAVTCLGEWHADFREKVEHEMSPLMTAYLAHRWVQHRLNAREPKARAEE